MIKKHGSGCKKRIVHWGYYLLPVWLRLGPGITKIGGSKQTRKGAYDHD
jgi:hypothetical protein